MWTTLLPLMIGSAIVPIQIIITILLLKTPGGIRTAMAWVGGMTSVRLAQGVLFGLVFTASTQTESGNDGPGVVSSVLLLVVALLFFVTGAKQLLTHEDEDAPPPKWMSAVSSMTPKKAFLIGAGLLIIGAKFWVFTLSGISAISDAQLSLAAAAGVFLIFVVVSEIAHISVLAIATLMPKRSDVLLERMTTWLSANNRIIMIILGAVFGTWFMIKALTGLGVL
ncbi:GAP family protein [Corynebacterium alimapuense]|nr:GAP family protein [Corynebacterium alimapuense]